MTERSQSRSVGRRLGRALGVVGLAFCATAGVAGASNAVAGLSQSSGDVAVPQWLYLASGGGAVGAMALLSMLVTDRVIIDGYHERSLTARLGALRPIAGHALSFLGVGALAFVLVVAFLGPTRGNVSGAVLLAFVGVRALLTMVAYTVGNPWPALDPWRTIAGILPNGFLEYPTWLGSWPAVGGLLAFVWLEVVAPLASSPRALGVAVLGYSAFTIAGAVAFSPETWFRRGDPLSVWFRCYGAVAPIGRREDGRGLELRAPGSRLSDTDVVTDLSAVAVPIVLVWELTYSGFIVTSPGATTVEALVGVGLPPALVYLALLLAGFALFYRVFLYAADRCRRRAETYLSRRYLAIRFAPALIAIAAGYHFAHYVGFALSLWPSFLDSILVPLSPPVNPTVLALPGWFGFVEIAGVLLGHALAVWVAHTTAFELFPGRLQAIRSQYPFVAVMVAFTMVSLWILSLPTAQAPFVPS